MTSRRPAPSAPGKSTALVRSEAVPPLSAEDFIKQRLDADVFVANPPILPLRAKQIHGVDRSVRKVGAFYGRVSYDPYGVSHSPDDQWRHTQERAADAGIDIDPQLVILEHDIPGRFFLKRPGIQKLLNEAERGSYQVLCFNFTSRLGRRAGKLLEFQESLARYGIELWAPSFGFIGPQVMTFLAALAEGENIEKGDAIRRAAVRKVKDRQDVYTGGLLPYGCKLLDGPDGRRVLAKDPETWPHLVWIFEKFSQGVSRVDICRTLNKKGIKSPLDSIWRDQTLWNPSYPHLGMLRNEKYIGMARVGKTMAVFDPKIERDMQIPMNPEHWTIALTGEPPLLDVQLFMRVQERLDKQMESAKRQRENGLRPVLDKAQRSVFPTKKFFCSECNRSMKMTASRNDGTKRIGCSEVWASRHHFVDGKQACTNTRTFNYRAAVHGVVQTVVRVLSEDPIVLQRYAAGWHAQLKGEQQEAEQKRRTLLKERAGIEAAIEKIADGWERGIIPADVARRRSEQRREELAALDRELVNTRAPEKPIEINEAAIDDWRERMTRLSTQLETAGSSEVELDLIADLNSLVTEVTIAAPPHARVINLSLYGKISLLAGHKSLGDPVLASQSSFYCMSATTDYIRTSDKHTFPVPCIRANSCISSVASRLGEIRSLAIDVVTMPPERVKIRRNPHANAAKRVPPRRK